MSIESKAPSETFLNDELGKAVQKPIPQEIYLHITTLLAKSDLATCMRVSSSLNNIIAPLIYQKLNVDLRLARHPLSARNLSIDQSTIPARKSLDPFSYTTHLTLISHFNETCSSFPPLIMPNLEHLRISQLHPSPGFDVCIPRPGPTFTRNTPIVVDTESSCCPLLVNLRPKTVELGDSISGFFGTGLGLWTSSTSTFPPSWLDNLVINIGWGAEIDPSKRSFLQDLPISIKRSTLILTKSNEEGEIWDDRWKWRKGEDAWVNSKHSWVKLALATAGDAALVEIVGLEQLVGWEGWTEEEVECKARETLAFCLMKGEGLPFLTAERLVKKVKLVEMEAYLAR